MKCIIEYQKVRGDNVDEASISNFEHEGGVNVSIKDGVISFYSGDIQSELLFVVPKELLINYRIIK